MNCHDFFLNSSFLRAQTVLKFEFTVTAIIIFVKNIKKASSGIFTLWISQLYELSKFYPIPNNIPSSLVLTYTSSASSWAGGGTCVAVLASGGLVLG